MNQHTNLLADSSNAALVFDRTTPFPAAQGFYRSRIYTSNININPLVAACDQLFGLVAALKTTEYPDNIDKFLQDLAHEIRSFEHRSQVANYPSNIIVAARYAICCLLDETISQTPWGQTNNWQEKNLLSLFHNENYGGARFFSIVDRTLENISNNLHLIELLYLCLNFGFTGKYKEVENGQNELVAITNRLYQIIGQHGFQNHKNIIIHDEQSEPEQKSEQNQVIPIATAGGLPVTAVDTKKLFLLVVSFAIAISSLIYLGVNFKLNQLSKPIYTAIAQSTKDSGENQS